MVSSGVSEAADARSYPQLQADMDVADRILKPEFEKADHRAGSYQRKFRYSELAIIYGGVVAVGLGVLSGLEGGSAAGWIEMLLTATLGALAFVSGGLKWHQRWVRQRWMAEELRGEHFLFVGRVGDYAEAAEPERVLRSRVVAIERQAREVKDDV